MWKEKRRVNEKQKDRKDRTRVDMSKGLHFAYTSHGKSLTITLLTCTLTRFKQQ